MANRFVQSRLWHSTTFRPLPPEAKLFYVYLLTAPHSNLLGCFSLPVAYAAGDLGWTGDQVEEALTHCSRAVLNSGGDSLVMYDYDCQVVLLPNYLAQIPLSGIRQESYAVSAVEDLPFSAGIFAALLKAVERFNPELENLHASIEKRIAKHELLYKDRLSHSLSEQPEMGAAQPLISHSGTALLDKGAKGDVSTHKSTTTTTQDVLKGQGVSGGDSDVIDHDPQQLSEIRQVRLSDTKHPYVQQTAAVSSSSSSSSEEDKSENKTPPLIPPQGGDRDAEIKRRFDLFWAEYPNKKGKARALKFWIKSFKAGKFRGEKLETHELFSKIMEALENWKRTKQWVLKGAIPYGSTWLNPNDPRFEDEFQERDFVGQDGRTARNRLAAQAAAKSIGGGRDD